MHKNDLWEDQKDDEAENIEKIAPSPKSLETLSVPREGCYITYRSCSYVDLALLVSAGTMHYFDIPLEEWDLFAHKFEVPAFTVSAKTPVAIEEYDGLGSASLDCDTSSFTGIDVQWDLEPPPRIPTPELYLDANLDLIDFSSLPEKLPRPASILSTNASVASNPLPPDIMSPTRTIFPVSLMELPIVEHSSLSSPLTPKTGLRGARHNYRHLAAELVKENKMLKQRNQDLHAENQWYKDVFEKIRQLGLDLPHLPMMEDGVGASSPNAGWEGV